MNMKKFLYTAALLFVTAITSAQNTIKVQAPSVVGLEEQFNVTFVIAESVQFLLDTSRRSFPACLGASAGNLVERPDHKRQENLFTSDDIYIHTDAEGYRIFPDTLCDCIHR